MLYEHERKYDFTLQRENEVQVVDGGERGFFYECSGFHFLFSNTMNTPSVSAFTRRRFVQLSAGATAAALACPHLAAGGSAKTPRLGAVAYNYQYSLGLFAYKTRPGDRLDCLGFLEAVQKSGGQVAQFFGAMISDLDAATIKRVRARAEELGLAIEVQGGTALQPNYLKIMEQAAALGAKAIGCSFGMLLRPDKIATLEAWDAHLKICEARLRELAPHAQRLSLVIGVEDHLDFSLEDLHGLISRLNSPHVGVLFDVGNWLGTLDDPIEAAERLGPFTVMTHYKDFAVEEMPFGFRLTMVPLGCGSLDLPGITAALLKHLRPETNIAIEMMNGQQLDVKWLEKRFWLPYRNKPAADAAATLNHIRRQKISLPDLRRLADIDALPHAEHIAFEQRQSQRCIEYLKNLIASPNN